MGARIAFCCGLLCEKVVMEPVRKSISDCPPTTKPVAGVYVMFCPGPFWLKTLLKLNVPLEEKELFTLSCGRMYSPPKITWCFPSTRLTSSMTDQLLTLNVPRAQVLQYVLNPAPCSLKPM